MKNVPTYDGIGEYLKDVVEISKNSYSDPVKVLKESGAQILISYLPVGSQIATEYWAEICLKAKVAMVNCIPVFIASKSCMGRKIQESRGTHHR